MTDIKLEVGRMHLCKLQSDKRVFVVLHGTKEREDGTTEYDLTVNGVRNTYTDINTALGEPVLSVEPLY